MSMYPDLEAPWLAFRAPILRDGMITGPRQKLIWVSARATHRSGWLTPLTMKNLPLGADIGQSVSPLEPAAAAIRLSRKGQSYSALPRYVRRLSARLSRERRRPRCPDSALSSQFSCALTKLSCPQVASAAVDQRRLGSAE